MARIFSRQPAGAWLAQTTGGTIADLPNTGVSVISSTAAERYTLQAPVAGCVKTLVAMPSNTTTVTVELSTLSSGDSVVLQHSTGVATATEIVFASTVAATRVDLVGLSTAAWLVTGIFANTTAAGIVFQAS